MGQKPRVETDIKPKKGQAVEHMFLEVDRKVVVVGEDGWVNQGRSEPSWTFSFFCSRAVEVSAH